MADNEHNRADNEHNRADNGAANGAANEANAALDDLVALAQAHVDGKAVLQPPTADHGFDYDEMAGAFWDKFCPTNVVLMWLRQVVFRTTTMVQRGDDETNLYMMLRRGGWTMLTEGETQSILRNVHVTTEGGFVNLWRIFTSHTDLFPAVPWTYKPDMRDYIATFPYAGMDADLGSPLEPDPLRLGANVHDLGDAPFNVFAAYLGVTNDKECDLDAVLLHIKCSWCAGDEVKYEWFLDWIACAAFSGQRIGVPVVIRIGFTKGWRMDVVECILSHTFSTRLAYGDYQSHGVDCGPDSTDAAHYMLDPIVITGRTKYFKEGSRVGEALSADEVTMRVRGSHARYIVPNRGNHLVICSGRTKGPCEWAKGTVVLRASPCFKGDKQHKALLRNDTRAFHNVVRYFHKRWLDLCAAPLAGATYEAEQAAVADVRRRARTYM